MKGRVIKFRAWHKKKAMYLRAEHMDVVPRIDPEKNDVGFELKGGKEIVLEQFTGMQDCTGRDIYEGDIITAAVETYPWFDKGKPNYVGVIEWVFGSWQYVYRLVNKEKRGISDGMNNGLDDDGEGGKHFRVIGHVHEAQWS